MPWPVVVVCYLENRGLPRDPTAARGAPEAVPPVLVLWPQQRARFRLGVQANVRHKCAQVPACKRPYLEEQQHSKRSGRNCLGQVPRN